MGEKLKVFVSSTYTDLIEEHQAATQAILDAGHIPISIEFFRAGKSQLKEIYRLIEKSDLFILILGGYYGYVEKESGLSFTELEYRYAINKDIFIYPLILSDNFLLKKLLMT